MSLTRILMIAATLMFGGFGLIGLMDPVRTMETIHMQPKDITALSEVRAMYGGFQLGVALFLIACLMNRWSLRAGLFLTTAIFIGAASGRGKSALAEGMPDPFFIQIWIFELLFATVCVFALMKSED